MPTPGSDHGRQEEAGGSDRNRIGEQVAIVARYDRGAAQDDLPDPWRRKCVATEKPRGHPVRTAHVSGEERHIKAGTCVSGGIGNDLEVCERSSVDRFGVGLEVLPEKEDSYHVAPDGADPRELVAHLARIEPLPSGHRLAPGPVVDLQGAAFGAGVQGLGNARIGSYFMVPSPLPYGGI